MTDYKNFEKKSADKPKKVRVSFDEKDEGYAILTELKNRYSTDGVKTIVTDGLKAVLK